MKPAFKEPHHEWYEHVLFISMNKRRAKKLGICLAQIFSYYGYEVCPSGGMLCVALPQKRSEMTKEEYANWYSTVISLLCRYDERNLL